MTMEEFLQTAQLRVFTRNYGVSESLLPVIPTEARAGRPALRIYLSRIS